MTDKKPLYLIVVIAKIKDIAEHQYDGKIYDNILAIFNKLTTKEKRVLLRGLINLCFIVEDKVLLNNSDLDPIKNHLAEHHPTVDDKKDIEMGNVEDELLKLRKSAFKNLILTGGGIILLVFVILSSYEPDVYKHITKAILNFFKYIIFI